MSGASVLGGNNASSLGSSGANSRRSSFSNDANAAMSLALLNKARRASAGVNNSGFIPSVSPSINSSALRQLAENRKISAALTNNGNVSGAKQLANLRAIAAAKTLAATTLRETANSSEAERKAARNAAKKAIKDYADMNVSSIIPINFKGDGLGRTAGYGYKFNKGKTFGNFAHGFPFKYYRVYGNGTNNVTQRVKNVQKMLKNIQDAKEAVDEATILAKQKARDEQRALREHQVMLNQQQKNLFLAEREMSRAGRGAVLSGAMTPERLAKLQELAILEMKNRITGVLQGVETPGNQYEALLADRYKIFKSFERLPAAEKEKLIKLTKDTVRSKARAGLATTAGRKVGRAYNVASYYTRGRPAASREFENVFLQGSNTGPAPLSRNYTVRAPKPSAAPRNAAAPRRGLFSGMRNFFTRKSPSTAAAANAAI